MLITLSVRWASASLSFAMKMTQPENKSYWFFSIFLSRVWTDSVWKCCPLIFLSMSLLSQDENGVVLSLGVESQRVILSARPFRLDIMEGREVLMSLNSRGLLAFEHLRIRKDTWETTLPDTYKYEQWLLIHTVTLWMSSVFVPMFVFGYCLWLVVLSSSSYRPSFSYKVTSTVASVWDNVKRVFSR